MAAHIAVQEDLTDVPQIHKAIERSLNMTVVEYHAHKQPRQTDSSSMRDGSILAATSTLEMSAEEVEWIAQSVPGGKQNIESIHRLAPLQEGMLFDLLLETSEADPYVVATLLRLSSRERVSALAGAFQAVVNRHSALRSAVLWEKVPHPLMVVLRQAIVPVEVLASNAGCNVDDFIAQRMQPGWVAMSLQRPPLLKLQILDDSAGEGCLVLFQMHHLVCDHQSWRAILSEVTACIEGREEALLPPVPYWEYVADARARAETQQALEFFRSNFGDVTEPCTPLGIADRQSGGGRIKEARRRLDLDLSSQIRELARRAKVTAATLFHAAWGLVVARTSGSDDVVYGTVLMAARHKSPRGQRVGIFINTLPLRLRLRDTTVQGLIDQTQRGLTGLLAYKHSPLPFALRCSGVPAGVPLFTSLLNYRHSDRSSPIECSGGSALQLLAKGEAWTRYPIEVNVDDFADEFEILARTDESIDAERIVEYLGTAVESIAKRLLWAPQTPALTMEILPDAERAAIVKGFNGTQTEYPKEKLIHQLFEEQVMRTPGAMAVVYEGASLSYAELNARANQLARYLVSRGVGPDQLVGICVERSLEMVIGLLGILKAGGAYVPVDPDYPRERLEYMLTNAAPRVLLIQEHLRLRVERLAAEVLALDSGWTSVEQFETENLNPSMLGLRSRNLAYVIYTSGSTGQPKGAMNEHRALVNRLQWMQNAYQIGESDWVLQKTPFSFDVAGWEFFWTLMSGACLVVARPRGHQDPEYLRKVIEEFGITTLHFVPSMLQIFLSQLKPGSCSSIRRVVCSGEELSVGLQNKCLEVLPGARLSNLYGPTEAAIDVTAWECELDRKITRVPIGKPISNVQMYVLDQHLQPVPVGVTGEIYIGGVGVGRGYLNRPELTMERFIPDPFSSDLEAHLYKTGDVGKWRPDGAIEYLGRNDDQVKIRGLRIELGEIETQLACHGAVKEVVVLALEDASNDKRLVAYVVPKDPAHVPTPEQFRSHLKAALPEYMIPSAFVILEQMPLTPNGKLDRRALPAPSSSGFTSEQYEEPQGEIERRIAELWRGLLNVERVGRWDSFFDLGGHSLLVLKMLFKLDQAFSTQLSVTDVYKTPTVQALAERIAGAVTENQTIDLAQEAALEESITPVRAERATVDTTVLLTGATGFVGRFLLSQILNDTNSTIYCLVRARSQQEAFARLKGVMQRWDLWRDELEPRIVAVAGDLRSPHLGIESAMYEVLSERVDSIYHCATSMNHLETYAMAKATNVESVKELLRLATRKRTKSINYVSTVGVFNSEAADQFRVVDESTSIENEGHRCANGYAASKWVAEKIVMTAMERGIPCNIFRLGLIWGDSQLGRYDELQRVYRIFKSCMLSGYGIQNYQDYESPFTPVDFVVRAIVHLSGRHRSGGEVFHLSAPRQIPQNIFERCNAIRATSLELLPFYEWICAMRALHREGRSLPAVPLIEFAFSMDENSFYELLDRTRNALRLDCSRTLRELEVAGIVPPVVDDRMLAAHVQNMLSRDVELREGVDAKNVSNDSPLLQRSVNQHFHLRAQQ